MNTNIKSPTEILSAALARYHAGLDPALIELPELAVFPYLIPAAPVTGRRSRMTGVLLGKPAPVFVKRGRSVRYRLKDILDWMEAGETFTSTADIAARKAGQ